MSNDLVALGMKFDKWQDAVEAAISTNKLSVTGEVRGGQLIQYADSSGAQINILAVEPFATYAGFDSVAMSFAHVTMLNDVLALCDIIDYNGQAVTSLTCNLAQGPLLVDEPEQRWQQVAITALASAEDLRYYPTVDDYVAETGNNPDFWILMGFRWLLMVMAQLTRMPVRRLAHGCSMRITAPMRSRGSDSFTPRLTDRSPMMYAFPTP